MGILNTRYATYITLHYNYTTNMNFVKQSEQQILTVLKILYLCFPNNLHIVILRNFFLTLDAMVK